LHNSHHYDNGIIVPKNYVGSSRLSASDHLSVPYQSKDDNQVAYEVKLLPDWSHHYSGLALFLQDLNSASNIFVLDCITRLSAQESILARSSIP